MNASFDFDTVRNTFSGIKAWTATTVLIKAATTRIFQSQVCRRRDKEGGDDPGSTDALFSVGNVIIYEVATVG